VMKKLFTGTNCKLCINNVPVPAARDLTIKIGARSIGKAYFSAYDTVDLDGKKKSRLARFCLMVQARSTNQSSDIMKAISLTSYQLNTERQSFDWRT
jgi:hypothetical protein